MPTACAAAALAMRPPSAIAVAHALHRGPHGLPAVASYSRAKRSDLVHPPRRNRRALSRVDALCAVPFDVKRRQLRVRSPPLHRETHGLRLCVAPARVIQSRRAVSGEAPLGRDPPRPGATRCLTRLRYCALRPLRRWRGLSHFGASPNSPTSHKTKPPIARMAISPAIRNRRITQVD